MITTLTPPPGRHQGWGEHHGGWSGTDGERARFGAGSVITPSTDPDGDPAAAAARLERERRWACEWWPPD